MKFNVLRSRVSNSNKEYHFMWSYPNRFSKRDKKWAPYCKEKQGNFDIYQLGSAISNNLLIRKLTSEILTRNNNVQDKLFVSQNVVNLDDLESKKPLLLVIHNDAVKSL